MNAVNRWLLCACLWAVFPARAPAADPPPPETGFTALSIVSNGKGGLPTVAYVAAKGPAAEAGVQVGDSVVAVDKVPATDLSMTQMHRSVRGPAGQAVQLTLRRAGGADLEVSVVRRPFLAAYGPAAAAGDPRAQYEYGLFYEHYADTDRKLAEAADWYRKAAEGKNAAAQVKLADYLTEGWGIAKDLPEAFHWYNEAARQEDAEAERKLGLCYFHGTGVAREYQSASKWFAQSAGQDDPVAEEYLAYLYREGHGVARDDRAAFAWYYQSAGHDVASAETNLAYLYFAGRGVARDDRQAFAWYYRAAVLNDPQGQWGVGTMYSSGHGVKRDQAEALRWYRKAEAALPDDQILKDDIARVRLGMFLRQPGASSTFDSSMLPGSVKRWLPKLFVVLAVCYLLGGLVLLRLTFRAGGGPVKLPVAFGWIFFLAESQGVAFVGLCLTSATFVASTLLAALSVLPALPVIASSCGPARFRLWKKPAVSPGMFWLFGLAALLSMFFVSVGYQAVYISIMHAPPAGQPTVPLLTKAKAASAWMTYASAAFLLPVAEEIIFRGYLFDAARRYFSDRNVMLFTALAFAAVHLQLAYFVPLVSFGLVMGWARARTDSLWLPVLLHMINNGVSLVFSV